MRDKVLYNLVAFAVLLMASTYLLGQLTAGQDIKIIKDLGLAAISYDSPEIVAAFSRQRGITFPLLSDADSSVIKAFGLLNPAVEWGLGSDRDDPFVVDQVRTFVSAAGRASVASWAVMARTPAMARSGARDSARDPSGIRRA